MSRAQQTRSLYRYPRRQYGAALLVMLVIMVMGGAALLISSLSTTALKNARQETTAAALAQAKEALIGRAVADNTSPGSLPCPDTNDDGSAESTVGQPGGNCPSYTGRLPWRTLKLPDLRDGSGERLWYALSSNFRDYVALNPINSNSKGTLPIYRADGTNPLTETGYDAVAVIFSPGSVLESQARNTTAERNNAVNYLDIANGRNNASSSGPFIAGTKSDDFNDQLLFITTKNLMPLVEQRVADEVKRALNSYYAQHTYYPWADTVDQASDYDSNDGLNRGWLPNQAGPIDWGTASPSSWFFDNQWYKSIYYSVAKINTEDPGDCYSCVDDTLSVDGTSGISALFIMSGTPLGTLERTVTNLTHYLEDSENSDDANDRYITPASNNGDRDRLYRLP